MLFAHQYSLVPWTISKLVLKVLAKAGFARNPNWTAKLANGEFAPPNGLSFSKTLSLRPLGPTLLSLSPGYSAIVPEREFSL